jgi:hypothetical protein
VLRGVFVATGEAIYFTARKTGCGFAQAFKANCATVVKQKVSRPDQPCTASTRIYALPHRPPPAL